MPPGIPVSSEAVEIADTSTLSALILRPCCRGVWPRLYHGWSICAPYQIPEVFDRAVSPHAVLPTIHTVNKIDTTQSAFPMNPNRRIKPSKRRDSNPLTQRVKLFLLANDPKFWNIVISGL